MNSIEFASAALLPSSALSSAAFSKTLSSKANECAKSKPSKSHQNTLLNQIEPTWRVLFRQGSRVDKAIGIQVQVPAIQGVSLSWTHHVGGNPSAQPCYSLDHRGHHRNLDLHNTATWNTHLKNVPVDQKTLKRPGFSLLASSVELESATLGLMEICPNFFRSSAVAGTSICFSPAGSTRTSTGIPERGRRSANGVSPASMAIFMASVLIGFTKMALEWSLQEKEAEIGQSFVRNLPILSGDTTRNSMSNK